MKKPLVILTGPTAVGKTELSISLAKKIGGEIISADSMQVYRKMDIGTAKITPQEMDGVKHHLIDCLDFSEDFNVFSFKKLALAAMEEIYGKGHIPIITGGTGFYIGALLYDTELTEAPCESNYRTELEEYARENGNHALFEMLREVDPKSCETIHENNVKRVIRALEFFKQNGSPISAHNEEERAKKSPYNNAYFVLNDDREVLYERINRRVDIMLENGLLDEVKMLRTMGLSRGMTAAEAIGYKQLFDYTDGLSDLDSAIEQIKMDSRRYAKRQLTWFRREKDPIWLDRTVLKSNDEIMTRILSVLKERGIYED